MDYSEHVTSPVPQSEPLHPGQIQNRAGGFVERVDQWTQLERFLILGTEGGTYYASEREMTREGAKCVEACLRADPHRALALVGDISNAGRAVKNDPAIFVMALAAKVLPTCGGDHVARLRAHLPSVIRTNGHLLAWAKCCRALGVNLSGRGMRKLVAETLTRWGVEGKLPYQLAKYQQRAGFSTRDLLRCSRAKVGDVALDWAVGKPGENWPALLAAVNDAATHAADPKRVAQIVREHKLTREMVPTEALASGDVWEALLAADLPFTALIRNLAQMTRVGLIGPLSAGEVAVCDRLADADGLRKARVHPLSILLASRAYGAGRPLRGGSSTWTPSQKVLGALDDAFYASFANVQPTGKRILLAVDVSGSMLTPIAGLGISSAEIAGVMALAIASREPNHFIFGFAGEFQGLPIRPGMSLADATRAVQARNFGTTDAAVPWRWAQYNRVQVDAVVSITDGETWVGDIHPAVAAASYRKAIDAPGALGIAAATTATNCSVYPDEPRYLNVVGADASLPAVIAAHIGSACGQPDDA